MLNLNSSSLFHANQPTVFDANPSINTSFPRTLYISGSSFTSVWLFFPKSSYENTQKWKQKEKVMESQESVLLWSRNNALVFTSFVVAPPCCFVGIFREMISSYQTDVSMHILLKNLSQISMSQCLNPLFPTSLFSLAYGKLSANLVLFSTNSWNWKERLLVL